MRILVTAGPTREYLDPVRFLSNASSGKLGYALAGEAARRGHRVELISGPVDLPFPRRVKVTSVVTSQEMFDAAAAIFPKCHAAIMAAAVCDYRPAKRSSKKLHRTAGARTLTFRPTLDICAHLGRIKNHRILVGFALEDRDEHARAEGKLRRKRCDAVVLNRPGNIGGDRAAAEILLAGGQWQSEITGTKAFVARQLIRLVENLWEQRQMNKPS